MSLDENTKGIKAVLIFDIIGRPKEYLVEALGKIVEEIDKEKGTRVVDKKINEPVVMKERNDFFTDFAEVEVEVEQVFNLIILMFKYMPAHIEIISPELISLSNSGWTDALTEITRRLHGYDEIARILQNEKGILEAKLRELLGNKTPEKETMKNTKVKKISKIKKK